MGRTLRTALLVAAAVVAAPASAHAGVKAGAAELDASWHVGASAGQYASDGTFVSDHGVDPHTHSVRRKGSYGRQSELKIRALVVEGPDGKRMAIVKNDLYIPQDGLHRRTAQLLEAGSSGITRKTLTMAVTHNHSSPYYSSPSWGVALFQDVFDARFYDYYSKRQAAAVEKAAANLKPVRVGASVSQFDKTHRHSFGGAVADDGSPAGYPQSDSEHDLAVVRFDDISDPAHPRPLANLVNFPLHPEFLEGNDLISADYIGPLQRMTDRATKAMTIWTQGSVGTAEPERSAWHSVHERLEFSHKDYAQAEYGARLMSNAIVDTWRDVERRTPADPQRFVPFMSDFPVQMVDRWYPGPFSHPYPGVSNCRIDRTLAFEPQVPIVGLPDCAGAGAAFDQAGFTPPEQVDEPFAGADPGLTSDDIERLGIPVPENFSAPGYTGLEEDLNVHLQAFRLGDILFTICSCEQWKDQGANIKTRTDKVEGNEHLGYDWSKRCARNGDGSYGGGAEGWGSGTWDCPDPTDPKKRLSKVEDHFLEKMRAQVNNPANGWDDLENAGTAESEPTDLRKVKGNFTHDDGPRSAQLGYRLTVAVGQANDYNGYIASYREYQRGDHYRKALTAWGPHSSDYMASRLVALGRRLKSPAEPLPTAQQQEELLQPRIDADNAANDVRATTLGTVGASLIAAYETLLPPDGGRAEAVSQPKDIERFGAAFFTWNGGSNFTDSPDVRVQHEEGGQWRDYADGSGELPLTLRFPQGQEVAAYVQGNQRWEWTAHFEAFVSRFDLGDRPRATPAGRYRFVARGRRREGASAVPYTVTSRAFEVRPWSGITIEDLRREPDGRVSFRVGPRHTYQAKGDGGPEISAEIGPVDYPDSYASPARFIREQRTFVRDPDAPADASKLEWFCNTCSFRPWLDAGDVQSAELTFVAPGSSRRVPAVRRGDRWVSTLPLAAGETAQVAPGGVRDGSGNANGAQSAALAGRSGCTRPTGSLHGRSLGPAALGRTRSRNRRAFTAGRVRRSTIDLFCLSDRRLLRIGYPSRAFMRRLSRRERARVRGRAVFAATTSRRYRAAGLRPGSRARRVRGPRYRVGANTWVVRRGRRASALLKIRRGRVVEVGVADRRLTAGPRATIRYLRSFH